MGGASAKSSQEKLGRHAGARGGEGGAEPSGGVAHAAEDGVELLDLGVGDLVDGGGGVVGDVGGGWALALGGGGGVHGGGVRHSIDVWWGWCVWPCL